MGTSMSTSAAFTTRSRLACCLVSASFLALFACSDTAGGPLADVSDDASTAADSPQVRDAAVGPLLDAAADAARDAGTVVTDPPVEKRCLDAEPGAYCGDGGRVTNGKRGVLYTCAGLGAPRSEKACALGCLVRPPGSPDECATPPANYKLPWAPTRSMQLTQDCNDSCCQDHIGNDKFSWDFATAGAFMITASRGGVIKHLKMNSTSGCGAFGCANQVNYLVIDHGDGTQATYMHMAGNTLAPGVTCGAAVKQGQALAMAGTTGWSTGIHLHFQVNAPNTAAAQCECGTQGNTCNAYSVDWNAFWVTAARPALAINFSEWPAAACNDRSGMLPASQNVAP
jgi:hypothetical protein